MSADEIFGCEIYPAVCAICISESLLRCCQLQGIINFVVMVFCRIVFWTDWDANFPRIEAASMSGSGRHVVFKDMEIGAWPNGLTLDHLERRIIWTDAR